jgi:hypothetical protein
MTYTQWSPDCDIYAFHSAPNPVDLAEGWDSNYSVMLADTNETWFVHTRRGFLELLAALVAAGYRIPDYEAIVERVKGEEERCRRAGMKADPPRLDQGNTTLATLWQDAGHDWRVYRKALLHAGWIPRGQGDAPSRLGVEVEQLVNDLVSAAHGRREAAVDALEPAASLLLREADILEAVVRYAVVGDRAKWLVEINW